jgi:hypothetical protein
MKEIKAGLSDHLILGLAMKSLLASMVLFWFFITESSLSTCNTIRMPPENNQDKHETVASNFSTEATKSQFYAFKQILNYAEAK